MTVPNVFIAFISALSMLWGVPSFASDGKLEINQACAVNGGCFEGDSAGYPITIDGSAGGSYQLTSNLIVPDKDTSGIWIDAPSISLNLNGFEIMRSGCEGATTDCTPESGGGSGVIVTAESNFGVSVRNGSITGMGNDGVSLNGRQAEAKGLRVRWNKDDGIFAAQASIITGNSAYENGGTGILVLENSIVSENISHGNGSFGIAAASGSKVKGNTSKGNALRDNCGGGICSERRRYYLTKEKKDGLAAFSACVTGFHMASVFEIRDTTVLAYDTVKGYTHPGSGGAGMPNNIGGWIMIGAAGENHANCNSYTTNLPEFSGSVLTISHESFFTDPALKFAPWGYLTGECSIPRLVWCVED